MILGSGREKAFFLSKTKKALDFVETCDPRRFRLLQKNIRGIAAVTRGPAVKCFVAEKICLIRLDKVFDCSAWFRTPNYASLLLHDAIYIRASERIPYKITYSEPMLMDRIELLGVLEELRFAKKVSVTLPEAGEWLQSTRQKMREYYERKIGLRRGRKRDRVRSGH